MRSLNFCSLYIQVYNLKWNKDRLLHVSLSCLKALDSLYWGQLFKASLGWFRLCISTQLLTSKLLLKKTLFDQDKISEEISLSSGTNCRKIASNFKLIQGLTNGLLNNWPLDNVVTIIDCFFSRNSNLIPIKNTGSSCPRYSHYLAQTPR